MLSSLKSLDGYPVYLRSEIDVRELVRKNEKDLLQLLGNGGEKKYKFKDKIVTMRGNSNSFTVCIDNQLIFTVTGSYIEIVRQSETVGLLS